MYIYPWYKYFATDFKQMIFKRVQIVYTYQHRQKPRHHVKPLARGLRAVALPTC